MTTAVHTHCFPCCANGRIRAKLELRYDGVPLAVPWVVREQHGTAVVNVLELLHQLVLVLDEICQDTPATTHIAHHVGRPQEHGQTRARTAHLVCRFLAVTSNSTPSKLLTSNICSATQQCQAWCQETEGSKRCRNLPGLPTVPRPEQRMRVLARGCSARQGATVPRLAPQTRDRGPARTNGAGMQALPGMSHRASWL